MDGLPSGAPRPLGAAFLVSMIATSTLPALRADDWPQWMGPERDNVWREDGILERFPDGGPEVLWRTPIAGGYAGPAVADGRVFVSDYVTKEDVQVPNFERNRFTGIERVLCLDAKSGDEKWKVEYPVEYGMSYPAGPRCTPTVDGDRVYTLGAEGRLLCLDVASGDEKWSKDLTEEYSTETALWGYASHPLVDGDKLLCVVGGEGSHVVAFDKKTGEVIWKALTSKEQGYSPPTILEFGGVRQLVLLRPDAVSSVNPDTGEEYWNVPYEATNGSIIMSPVKWKEHLYAGGFSQKNLLLDLSKDARKPRVVWRDLAKQAVAPVNVQPFLDGDVLYGFDQSGLFCAVEVESGDRLWTTPAPVSERRQQQVATAFIVQQGARYWLFSETGELVIARLSPEKYEEIDRAKVIEPTGTAFGRKVVWSPPAFADRSAFIRNDAELIRVDLSAAK